MGLSYFDLYLLHAPFRRSGEPFSRPLSEIWADMESLVEQGLCRAIGVSNFRVPDLQEILRSAKIKPAVNQVGVVRRGCWAVFFYLYALANKSTNTNAETLCVFAAPCRLSTIRTCNSPSCTVFVVTTGFFCRLMHR